MVIETTSPEQIVLVSSDDLPSGEGHHIGPPAIIRLPAHALLLRQLLPLSLAPDLARIASAGDDYDETPVATL